jgi:hypothetical protein
MRWRAAAERIWYYWRRNEWMADPSWLMPARIRGPVHGPIFLLGVQGGGLTLVSRMLRRHPAVVTLSGGRDYWVGADEIQSSMAMRLPASLALGGRLLHRGQWHPRMTPPHSWAYACDELLPRYRRTEADYDEHAAATLCQVISECVRRHGRGTGPYRFLDKSQTYTVKVGYLNALLRGTDPRFVLVTRDPYAACVRAASGKAGDMRRYSGRISLAERIAICAEHWANSMSLALEDGRGLPNFTTVRFEDILQDPSTSLRRICDFVGLSYEEEMIPQPGHRIPFGSKYSDRWYPLKPAINDAYLGMAAPEHLDRIAERCGPLAERLGYPRPLPGR